MSRCRSRASQPRANFGRNFIAVRTSLLVQFFPIAAVYLLVLLRTLAYRLSAHRVFRRNLLWRPWVIERLFSAQEIVASVIAIDLASIAFFMGNHEAVTPATPSSPLATYHMLLLAALLLLHCVLYVVVGVASAGQMQDETNDAALSREHYLMRQQYLTSMIASLLALMTNGFTITWLTRSSL